ncbi:hypothetical protein BDP55DRAFT_680884 [Colletotrichum godetiae]|uniref:Uncharacterized protein n=1 Tax=Colletotrichum godetiae TaxID=1209918 RepID=A0AAJ0ERZ4_9PEZI|nr:uncharacterized protein BDP55DRAFT_680884 [Colletotrichum godetiae]KAK1658968.1 hypothetical protein BDP55DRAFT_680884 [Colletotrichum godetiae]
MPARSVAFMHLCISRGCTWPTDAWVWLCGTDTPRLSCRSARLPSLQLHSPHRADVTAALARSIVLEADVNLWG